MKQGKGCEHCTQTGYFGRVGLFELLLIGSQTQQQVQSHSTASQIKATAIENGMKTLSQDGIEKMLAGQYNA